MFWSSFQNVFSLPSRFETSLFFLFISKKRTRGTRRKTINLKTKIETGEWYSEKRVSLYLSLLLISIQNFKSKAWIFLCDENLQKQSWVIFKKGGGHAATSVVGVWFHLFYDCNRSLASLEFQWINYPSTGWSKRNQGVGWQNYCSTNILNCPSGTGAHSDAILKYLANKSCYFVILVRLCNTTCPAL